MSNYFGNALKDYMTQTGLKEQDIAQQISYDITYISKWLNGAKLPSVRNGERIIAKLAACLAEASSAAAPDQAKIQSALQRAWQLDLNFQQLASFGSGNLFFLSNKDSFFSLLTFAFKQLRLNGNSRIGIHTTFDIVKLLGNDFRALFDLLRCDAIQEIELSLAIDDISLVEDYAFYCSLILDTIIEQTHMEFSITKATPERAKLMLIDNLLYIQILYVDRNTFMACYSTDASLIAGFQRKYEQLSLDRETILSFSDPANMRHTHVQLDSYADKYQRQLYNEAPSTLLPPELLAEMMQTGKAQGEDTIYLQKLQQIFVEYTAQAKIDLILYASAINDYVNTGKISIGNTSYKLSKTQVQQHLTYISECMRKNPEIRLFMVRDTIRRGKAVRLSPSIFLDSRSLSIENSLVKPNESYHISMYKPMMDAFGAWFNDIKRLPSCAEITPDDLLRYL